eukprot:1192583-Prorocentrum_minimum.AAC.1
MTHLSPRTREKQRQWEATLEKLEEERRAALLAQKEKELERKESWIAEKEKEVAEKEKEVFAALERERRAKEAAALPRSDANVAAFRERSQSAENQVDGPASYPLDRARQQDASDTEPEGSSSGFVDWLTEKILGSSTSSDLADDDDSEVRGTYPNTRRTDVSERTPEEGSSGLLLSRFPLGPSTRSNAPNLLLWARRSDSWPFHIACHDPRVLFPARGKPHRRTSQTPTRQAQPTLYSQHNFPTTQP